MDSASPPLQRFHEDMLALAEILHKELYEAREANNATLEGVAWQRYFKACQAAYAAYAVTLDQDYWEGKGDIETGSTTDQSGTQADPPDKDPDDGMDLPRRRNPPASGTSGRDTQQLAA